VEQGSTIGSQGWTCIATSSLRVYGCQGSGRTVTEEERFQTTTSALARLSGWLGERQVTLVAMEATSPRSHPSDLHHPQLPGRRR
jgi:hypothetical protein